MPPAEITLMPPSTRSRPRWLTLGTIQLGLTQCVAPHVVLSCSRSLARLKVIVSIERLKKAAQEEFSSGRQRPVGGAAKERRAGSPALHRQAASWRQPGSGFTATTEARHVRHNHSRIPHKFLPQRGAFRHQTPIVERLSSRTLV